MKRIIVVLLLSTTIALSLGACTMKNRDVGTLAGGATGAAVGAAVSRGNPLATVGGAVAGGVGGYYIGKSTEK